MYLFIYVYIFKDEIANNEIQQRSNRRSRTQGKYMYKTNHNNLDFARIKNHKDNTNYSISLIHLLKSLPHSITTLLNSSIEQWFKLEKVYSRKPLSLYILLTLLRSESKNSKDTSCLFQTYPKTSLTLISFQMTNQTIEQTQ